jgi:hypothetical protein
VAAQHDKKAADRKLGNHQNDVEPICEFDAEDIQSRNNGNEDDHIQLGTPGKTAPRLTAPIRPMTIGKKK